MRMSLMALALLAGCGGAAEQADNQAAEPGAEASEPAAGKAAADAVATTRLTGLWQGGPPGQPNQLCMVDKGTGNTQFGIVVWGANLHSCSGAGAAVREGSILRLAMAGDEACEIAAAIAGDTVTMPAATPAGCAYYCGARARFDGATFTRAGATAADAMKAKDLVGEPLCEG